ncbi:hypothetical protein M758_1G297100 [Ceratodon purpureus]|nr:hypothetical protein M758_UG046900 [Ceratodon purpureus]KAG0631999.1 hypothetical protein M758_1G297100 [Ceratodon purpureus]
MYLNPLATSQLKYLDPSMANTPRSRPRQEGTEGTPHSPTVGATSCSHELPTANDGVTTRRMATQEKEPVTQRPRPRFELTLLPHITNDAIAPNALCYILHPTPDFGNTIVAKGRGELEVAISKIWISLPRRPANGTNT